MNVKDCLIVCQRLCRNMNQQQNIDANLKIWFSNTCKCSNHDINKFILFLRKIITWKRTLLQSTEHGKYYWCRLQTQKKIVCKDFEIKHFGENYDLYV